MTMNFGNASKRSSAFRIGDAPDLCHHTIFASSHFISKGIALSPVMTSTFFVRIRRATRPEPAISYVLERAVGAATGCVLNKRGPTSELHQPWQLAVDITLGLRRLANKVCGIVRTSRAEVTRDLRVRTKRTRTVNLVPSLVGRDDPFRRLAALHPRIQRCNHVECVQSFAVTAVPQTRHHEQPHPGRVVTWRGSRRKYVRVVVDAGARPDCRIAQP